VLTAHRGTPICGLLPAAGLTDVDAGDDRPSIPLVGRQAACLGRRPADRSCHQARSRGANFAQYDVMIGPQRANRRRRAPAPGCTCEQRAALIAQVRRERRAGRPV